LSSNRRRVFGGGCLAFSVWLSLEKVLPPGNAKMRQTRLLALARGFATRRPAPRTGPSSLVPRAPGTGELVRADWEAVKDPHSGGTYFWNRRTDEVTAVGETPEARHSALSRPATESNAFGSLASFAAYGAGVTASFAVVRALLGW
jgi:hypothetical protein